MPGSLSHFLSKSSLTSEDPDAYRLQQIRDRVRKQYDGRRGVRGIFNQYQYRKPLDDEIDLRIQDLRAVEESVTPDLKARFRNLDGDVIDKELDLDVYYSAKRKKPRRLLVQATDETIRKYPHRHWRYRKVKGDVPWMIRMAELCLNPAGEAFPKSERTFPERIFHWILSPLLTILFAWVVQHLISVDKLLSPWRGTLQYRSFENYLWEWPKHAVNPLDRRPSEVGRAKAFAEMAMFNFPRRLVVKDPETGKWETKLTKEIRRSTGTVPRYIFISYSPECFQKGFPIQKFMERAAEAMMEYENSRLAKGDRPVDAYWLDKTCISADKQNPQETTEDVNSICDAVRGADRVYIVLANDTVDGKRVWGSRLWTLPEALLAANKMRYCVPTETGFACPNPNLSLTEMHQSFWDGQQSNREISLLVEHFTGTLTLSNLQLFACAVQALSRREVSLRNGQRIQVLGYSQTDVTYAAMGLLAYRIAPDPSDNNFQAIARLSLANDSDRLLERMVCLLPIPPSHPTTQTTPTTTASSEALLQNMTAEDQFGSRLWDITPLSQMVGVGGDSLVPTVILDQCHATPIRWKSFPAVKYSGAHGGLPVLLVRWASYWWNIGLLSLWTAIPLAVAIYGNTNPSPSSTSQQALRYFCYAVAAFFAIGYLLSLPAPIAIDLISRSPDGVGQLVGFEGTMDLRLLERIIFGNVHDRLVYTPSCTPLTRFFRHNTYRQATALDIDSIEHSLLPDQRLFTIVDMANYSVSIIAAERPPTVALICGRDGGMLRACLCSWRFERNCLFRETVMRLPSSVYDMTTTLDWVKISLASQGDVGGLDR